MTKRLTCPHCSESFDENDQGCESNESLSATASGPDVAAANLTGTGDAYGRRARRGRKTNKGILFRLIAGGTVLVLIAVIVRQAVMTDPRATPVSSASHHSTSPPKTPAQEPGVTGETASISGSATPTTQHDDQRPAVLADILKQLESSIVKIETRSPSGVASLGSGFVVEQSGLVATNYHVLADATEATVRFSNGLAYPIEGYVALDQKHDLAIVKLLGTPAGLSAVSLQSTGDPQQLSSVYAIGHPHGVEFSPYDGKVSRVITSSQLPNHSRQFLAKLISIESNPTWIQHTAQIAPGSSGGPLINSAGQVLGINTWVDRGSQFGYAIHARYLEDLKQDIVSHITPLASHAKPEARIVALLNRLDDDYVLDLLRKAELFQWQATNSQQYANLQELSWAITVANTPSTLRRKGGLTGQKLDKLVDATDKALAEIRKQQWTGPGQLLFLNEQAVQVIDQPLAGVLFLGTMQRIVTGPNESRGALIEVSGMGRTVFIPLDGQLFTAEPGTHCLVIGVNYDGQVARYGNNPLALTAAPIIASRNIIVLEEQ